MKYENVFKEVYVMKKFLLVFVVFVVVVIVV